MGLIESIFNLVFGAGRNVVAETAEVFRENAESGAARDAAARARIVQQFGDEFARPRRGPFDVLIDALNRLPRPAMALGTLGLFVSAMVDPVWFAARMQGMALVPEPLWWLLGAIVSFYFGARHQAKAQDFQRSLAAAAALAPRAAREIAERRAQSSATPGAAITETDAALTERSLRPGENAALRDWRGHRRNGR